MARRIKSLHHNLKEGENVIFHREHRSPRNRGLMKKGKLTTYRREHRRGWKNLQRSSEFQNKMDEIIKQKIRY